MLQEILDADDTPLVDRRGTKMSRDIVQFVPLRQFQRQGSNFSLVSSAMNDPYLRNGILSNYSH